MSKADSSKIKFASEQDINEFIMGTRDKIIQPLITDWMCHKFTLEEFVGHVFMSGVMYAGMMQEKKAFAPESEG